MTGSIPSTHQLRSGHRTPRGPGFRRHLPGAGPRGGARAERKDDKLHRGHRPRRSMRDTAYHRPVRHDQSIAQPDPAALGHAAGGQRRISCAAHPNRMSGTTTSRTKAGRTSSSPTASCRACSGHVDTYTGFTSHDDFTQRDAGLNPLEFEFEKRNRRLTLYDRENLNHAGARIAVVKKQRERLKALKTETSRTSERRSVRRFRHSSSTMSRTKFLDVNTVNPKAVDRKEAAINEYIVEILKLLPRACIFGLHGDSLCECLHQPKDSQDDLSPQLPSFRSRGGQRGRAGIHRLRTGGTEPVSQTREPISGTYRQRTGRTMTAC